LKQRAKEAVIKKLQKEQDEIRSKLRQGRYAMSQGRYAMKLLVEQQTKHKREIAVLHELIRSMLPNV
jgi:hypothetical protein